MRMYALIRFDREIDPEKHYISPGGYEVVLEDGAIVAFDFDDFNGYIDDDDRTLLHCYMKNLDVVSFPGATVLKKYCGTIKKFEEFYIYTGEGNIAEEEDINPVELVVVSLTNNDGQLIKFDKACLGDIWTKEAKS